MGQVHERIRPSTTVLTTVCICSGYKHFKSNLGQQARVVEYVEQTLLELTVDLFKILIKQRRCQEAISLEYSISFISQPAEQTSLVYVSTSLKNHCSSIEQGLYYQILPEESSLG